MSTRNRSIPKGGRRSVVLNLNGNNGIQNKPNQCNRRSHRQIEQNDGLQFGPQLRRSTRLKELPKPMTTITTGPFSSVAQADENGAVNGVGSTSESGNSRYSSVRGRGGRVNRGRIQAPRLHPREKEASGAESSAENSVSSVETEIAYVKPLDLNNASSPEYKVFTNPMLFDVLTRYLDYSTLKELSRASRLLRNVTRNSRKYINSGKLNILYSSIQSPPPGNSLMSALKSKFFVGKCVNLDVMEWRNYQVQIIKRVLKSQFVETLQLNIPRALTSGEDPRIGAEYDESIAEFIVSVSNLRSLAIDVGVLRRFSSFLTEKVMSHIRSLESLRILPDQEPAMDLYLNHVLGLIDNRDRILEDNLKILASRLVGGNLRVFHFLSTEYMDVNLTASLPQILDSLMRLIENNQTVIQDLALHGAPWSSNRLRTIVCPSLFSLEAKASAENSEILATFIRNQPLLHKISIHLLGLMRTLQIPDVIRERSTNLRQLSARWIYVDYGEDINGQPITFQWDFLQGLQHLQDLVIHHTYHPAIDHRASYYDLLPVLPTTLKKVSLTGIPPTYILFPLAQRDNRIISSLQGLSRLTTLNLKNARVQITDTVLQWIFGNMTQLLELMIHISEGITNFGITGKREGQENTGISLQNLKSLRKLSILKCPNVSLEALRSVVAHKELKELCLTLPRAGTIFTQETIVGIGCQNPSLEIFRLGYKYPSDIVNFSASLLQSRIMNQVPRFRNLQIQPALLDEDTGIEGWELMDLELVSDNSDSDDDSSSSSDSDSSDSDSDGEGFGALLGLALIEALQ